MRKNLDFTKGQAEGKNTRPLSTQICNHKGSKECNLEDYEEQMKSGVSRDDIKFDPIKLGIENADFWVQKNKSRS